MAWSKNNLTVLIQIFVGYIQQDDLFFGTLTVREHLVFHVILKYILEFR